MIRDRKRLTLTAKVIETFSCFNSNTTHIQSTNMANISLEVLDLDFGNQTSKTTSGLKKFMKQERSLLLLPLV